MQDTITTMFCLCDDFLKANGCAFICSSQAKVVLWSSC